MKKSKSVDCELSTKINQQDIHKNSNKSTNVINKNDKYEENLQYYNDLLECENLIDYLLTLEDEIDEVVPKNDIDNNRSVSKKFGSIMKNTRKKFSGLIK